MTVESIVSVRMMNHKSVEEILLDMMNGIISTALVIRRIDHVSVLRNYAMRKETVIVGMTNNSVHRIERLSVVFVGIWNLQRYLMWRDSFVDML